MMNTTIKLMTLLLALMTANIAAAYEYDNYDFEVDGIYYKIKNDEASVTYKTYRRSSHISYYISDYAGEVTIPATVTYDNKTYRVTSISDHAFYWRAPLTKVTIPNSVTSIGYSAFYRCSGLTSIEIPYSVDSIGYMAFEECTGLTRVEISDMASWYNIHFQSYASNPLWYAAHLYLNGTEVTDLTIPDSVTAISQYAFYGCKGLTSIVIPNSVTSIGDYAFEFCSGLTSIEFPNSVTSIGLLAFENCTGLNRVEISDIAAWCRIGFQSYASNPLWYAAHLYLNGTEVTDLTIPDSVTSISQYAFYGCKGLTSIVIPNSVTSIDDYAFYECTSLSNVTIGKSVTTIGNKAFMNVSSIETITCKAATPPAWSSSYQVVNDLTIFTTNVYIHTPLHVPIGCERFYMADPYWGQFITIIGDVNCGNPADVNGDGEVSIADANSVIDIIINGGNGGHSRIPSDDCGIIGDVNDDGEVNLADINAIIDLILTNN